MADRGEAAEFPLLLFLFDPGQCQKDTELSVLRRQAALDIQGIRFNDRSVGGKFNRRALGEAAGSHHFIEGVAGHRSRKNMDKGINRRRILNALREADKIFLTAQFHRLDDIGTVFIPARRHIVEVELFQHPGTEGHRLESAAHSTRSHVDALEKGNVLIEVGTLFLADAGCRQTVGDHFNDVPASRNVTTGRGDAAAEVLHQRRRGPVPLFQPVRHSSYRP